MPTEAKPIHPPRPRRRWLRRLLAPAVLLGVLVAGTVLYRHLTGPERVRAWAQTRLQRYVRGLGRVTVGSADFSWVEGARLFDIRVTETAGPSETSDRSAMQRGDGTMFVCPEVRIALDPLSALLNKPSINSITAVEPTCTIVRNAADGTTNVAALLSGIRSTDRDGGFPLDGSLPTIELTRARVRVVHRERGSDRRVHELTLTVRGRHAEEDRRLYDIVWESDGEKRARGQSQIDLESGTLRNISGGLPWMSVEAVAIAINAGYEEVGALLDLLGLSGDVRAVDYDLVGGVDSPRPRSATIELKNASLSIPISDQEGELPLEDRYLRFDRVDGSIRLTAGDVHHIKFEGFFHGSKCEVEAEIHCGVEKLLTLHDMGFDASMRLTRLQLPRPAPEGGPEQDRFIKEWPKLVKFFNDFDPAGAVDLELDLTKDPGADNLVVKRALIAARDVDATCRWFPYRVHELSGAVEYTPDGVYVRSLSGSHGAGTVRVDGWLAGPNRCAQAELHVTGTGITIDQDLYDACPEKLRKIRGLFAPRGAVDVDLQLTRPACTEGVPARFRPRCTVSFDDLSAEYTGFPYRVDHLAGKLVVDGERFEVVRVATAGASGEGRISINGTAAVGPAGLSELDVSVIGRDTAIDARLFAALPPETKERLAAFHPAGRFHVQTSLTLDGVSQKPTHTSTVTLLDATIQHEEFGVPITGIAGTIDLDAGRIVVHDVTGRYHDATISAAGTIRRAPAGGGTDLTIRSAGLRLDDALRAALPATLRDRLADWTVEGLFDTETVLKASGEHDPARAGIRDSFTYETVVRLDGVTVGHSAFPRPFDEVRGEVTFDATGLGTAKIEARYGPARIRGDIDAKTTARGEVGTIHLDVEELVLDEAMRDLLPEKQRAVWDRLEPAGVIDLRFEPLRYFRSGEGASREWSIAGRVELHDVALKRLLGIQGVHGVLTTTGTALDRLGGTTLQGGLNLSALGLLGRHATGIDGAWSFLRAADGRGLLTLGPVVGAMYDGRLKADVELRFHEKPVTYHVSTRITDMQLQPFINAGRPRLRGGGKPLHARGRADARLTLSGEVGKASSRQGYGRVEVHEGHMYRLPIMVQILRFLRLAPPDEDAFDEAKADFSIDGDAVVLRGILLRGRALALVGHGTYSPPDGGVDLYLAYSNPHGWPAVPIFDDIVKGFVRFHVSGPLSQPHVTPRPLGGVEEEIRRLFQKRKPKKMQPAAP